MKKLLVASLLLFLLFGCSGGSGSPTPTRTAVGKIFVNGIDQCPSRADYGIQVVDKINLWSDTDLTTVLTAIPHGTQVDLLQANVPGDFVEVRWNRHEGFIQDILISDYDPDEGVRPDESKC